jgi:hypothetical protein
MILEHTEGGRLSPGAAMWERDAGVMKSGAFACSDVAAPGDGRTPSARQTHIRSGDLRPDITAASSTARGA